MQRDGDTGDSSKPRIVLFCVNRSVIKPVAVIPHVFKISCYCETVTNVLIERLLCRFFSHGMKYVVCQNTFMQTFGIYVFIVTV